MKVQYRREIHVHEDLDYDKNRLHLIGETVCCDEMEKNSEFVEIETYANSVISYVREHSPKNKWGTGVFNHDMDKPLLVIQGSEGYGEDQSKLSIPIHNCPWCKESYEFECIETKKITHTCKKVMKEYEECVDETSEELLV